MRSATASTDAEGCPPADPRWVEGGVALLHAGLDLADLSPQRIAQEARIAEAPPQAACWPGVLRRIGEGLVEELLHDSVAATSGLPAGIESLCLLARRMLDAHLHQPALHELQGGALGLAEGKRLRQRLRAHWQARFRAELAAAGVAEPALPARLAAMLVLEVARHERQAGGPLAEARGKLDTFLRSVMGSGPTGS